MKLILVRHGHTVWNGEGRLQGHRDSPLSAAGIEQTSALQPFFRTLPADTLAVSSDLGRAVESTALIGFVAPALDPRLREMDLGSWSGRTAQEIRARDSESYTLWRQGRLTPPGGEAWETFRERVEAALSSAVRLPASTVAIVTHEGVVRAACLALAGLDPARIGPPSPGSITIFELPSRRMEDARIVAFNLAPLERAIQHQPLDMVPV